MTEPQHMTALALANAKRLAMAKLKREVAAGDLTVSAALRDPRAEPLPLLDLLCAQHRWGRERALRFLRKLKTADTIVSESRRVGDLTERQRLGIDRLLTPSALASQVAA